MIYSRVLISHNIEWQFNKLARDNKFEDEVGPKSQGIYFSSTIFVKIEKSSQKML